MANPKAFLSIERKEAGYRPLHERIADFGEVEQTLNNDDRTIQASRCMECGIPFCHWACPLGNKPPEWQDAVYKGKWKEAYRLLEETNDFPEFTGRICPALCEKACILNISFGAVTIRENEAAIAERAFEEGYIHPWKPKKRTGKRVAVIGSGPAGLAAANQLNRKGHSVTVFEKDEKIGGLLRFGIPDFKLNKSVIDRRLAVLKEEGITFVTSAEIGKNVSTGDILGKFDAVCVAIGAGTPRDLSVEGRELKGIYFALDFLRQQNRIVAGKTIPAKETISAKGKHVLVIGGGDTGSDCVGTSVRQGALSVTQIEIMPKPPVGFNPATPWPYYPVILKTTSSHQEGCERRWNLDTRRFIGEKGLVKAVEVAEVVWSSASEGERPTFVHTDHRELLQADLVLLAMGFVHPVLEGFVQDAGFELDGRRNIKCDATGRTSVDKVFAAGDASYGAGLVVRAIASGRNVAEEIDRFLAQ
ncbi:MAG: glutamate synthase subunit beta [Bacteroidales bacterium]|nr:glutamate synthase subunit beta [Bacteroidales bacterium]